MSVNVSTLLPSQHQIAHGKAISETAFSHADANRVGPNPYLSLGDATRAYFGDSRTTSLLAHPVELDSNFRRYHSLNGKFELRASEWRLSTTTGSLATARMVEISGAKNEILNTWIFPHQPLVTPIFAAELIGVARSPRVAFIDIQAIGPAPSVKELRPTDSRLVGSSKAMNLAAKWSSSAKTLISELSCDEVPPDWAIDASAGHFFFTRTTDRAAFQTIQDAYLAYLKTYCVALGQHLPEPESDSTGTEMLAEYQQRHRASSPGTKFLSTLFGLDWTDSFLTQFLFSTP